MRGNTFVLLEKSVLYDGRRLLSKSLPAIHFPSSIDILTFGALA